MGKRPFSTRLTIQFEVLPSGKVAWAHARPNPHKSLASCVVDVFSKWRFDERIDNAVVTYPFVFRPAPRQRVDKLFKFYVASPSTMPAKKRRTVPRSTR